MGLSGIMEVFRMRTIFSEGGHLYQKGGDLLTCHSTDKNKSPKFRLMTEVGKKILKV